jgi:hypothetical protein|nr:MAG TPA: hypothetical protein [Caudoviricetes sp.]
MNNEGYNFLIARQASMGVRLAILFYSYAYEAVLIMERINENGSDKMKALVDKVVQKAGYDNLTELKEFIISSCYIYDLLPNQGNIFKYQQLADLIGNFNNTILFRDYINKKGRRITFFNKSLDDDSLLGIKIVHQSYLNFLRYFFVIRNLSNFRIGSRDRIESTGIAIDRRFTTDTMKVFRYVESVSCNNGYDVKPVSLLKIDIGKFFNSVTCSKFIKNKSFAPFIFQGGDIPDNAVTKNLDNIQVLLSKEYKKYIPASLDFLSDQMSVDDNYSELLVDFETLKHIRHMNYRMLIYMISFLTHNNSIPTGMSYSPILSNIFIHQADIEISNFLYNKNLFGYRYLDDLTITSDNDRNLFKYAKAIEKIYNKYGLYLKYDKTCIQHSDKGNLNALGYSYNVQDGSVRLNAKYRKELIDLISDLDFSAIPTDLRLIGKLNYGLSARGSNTDVLMHYGFNQKKAFFDNLDNDNYACNIEINIFDRGVDYYKDIDISIGKPDICYKEFIHSIRFTRTNARRRKSYYNYYRYMSKPKWLAAVFLIEKFLSIGNFKYRIDNIFNSIERDGIKGNILEFVTTNPNKPKWIPVSVQVFVPHDLVSKMNVTSFHYERRNRNGLLNLGELEDTQEVAF